MIKINDKWGIVIDENNYSPAKLGTTKKGDPTVKRIGYYETLNCRIAFFRSS